MLPVFNLGVFLKLKFLKVIPANHQEDSSFQELFETPDRFAGKENQGRI